jgi:SAM-dependent methyltransferase
MTEGMDRHNVAQRRYFEERAKPRMEPRASRYLHRHVDELVRFASLTQDDRILEVGCGMGRYTLPLAERGYDVEGLDLSPVLIERLRAASGDRALRLHAADVADPPDDLVGRFDAAIGLFTLHHLHDLELCFRGMARTLRPGGGLAFLEPNPLNPLYYVQILVTPGMSWEGDGGIVRMRPRPVFAALEAAGFHRFGLERFGFFPPFAAETRSGAALERVLERFPPWRFALPFQLFRAELR